MSYERLMKKKASRKSKLARSKTSVEVTVVKKAFQWDYFFKILGRVELLAAIFAMPVLFWVGWNELESMADQRRVNAWQLISMKSEGNSGKLTALEFLNQDHYCLPLSDKCLLAKKPLMKVNLKGVYLQRVNLQAAMLRNANLSQTDLSGADLSDADLIGADLSEANLKGAILRNAKLYRADLRHAILLEAKLSDARLSRADLSDADLSGADLSNADLDGVKLNRVDLRGADLSGANLSRADLSGTLLSGADLSDADLIGADSQYVFPLHRLLENVSTACVSREYLQPRLPDRKEFKNLKLKLCPKK